MPTVVLASVSTPAPPPPSVWDVRLTPEQRREQIEREQREIEHAHRRLCLETALGSVGSACVGLYFMGYAMHTTDLHWAAISFWGGLALGYTGFTLVFARFYRAAERMGWW